MKLLQFFKKTSLLVIAFGLALPVFVTANDRVPLTEQEVAFISSAAIGEVILSEHASYQLIPFGQVRQTASSDSTESMGLSSADTLATGQWSSQLGSFLMEIDTNVSSAFSSSSVETSPYQLAYNPESKLPVVVTGNIIVNLVPGTAARAVAESHGLVLMANFDHLNMAVYIIDYASELVQKVEQLKGDFRVQQAYPEVLEHLAAPR